MTPMSGRMRGSSLLEADAHQHRRLLPVGGRHDRDDVARESASPDRRRAWPRPCWPGVTRLMKLSLTSTSISSDDMSTIVQMPVRVKPPPADTGEIISPGCASFEIATPENGARMTVSSDLVRRSATWRSATVTCSRDSSRRALSASTSASARSRSACPTIPSFTSARVRLSVRRASRSRTSISAAFARAASSSASDSST